MVININNLEVINNKVFDVRKVPLVPAYDDYNNTDSYGIYREDTKNCLGVVKGVFKPQQPREILSYLVEAIEKANLNPNSLSYKELKGGAKILFNLEIERTTSVNKAGVTDDVIYNLGFITGFDGFTSSQIFINSKRLICSNGMRVVNSEYNVTKKNTINNHITTLDLFKGLVKLTNSIKNYKGFIERLNKISINKETIEDFVVKCLNIDLDKEISVNMENKAMKLASSIEKEIDRTGYNAFALLNGATYYTNHKSSFKDKDEYLYLNTGKKINDTAQKFVAGLL